MQHLLHNHDGSGDLAKIVSRLRQKIQQKGKPFDLQKTQQAVLMKTADAALLQAHDIFSAQLKRYRAQHAMYFGADKGHADAAVEKGEAALQALSYASPPALPPSTQLQMEAARRALSRACSSPVLPSSTQLQYSSHISRKISSSSAPSLPSASRTSSQYSEKLAHEMQSLYDVRPSGPLREPIDAEKRTLATSNFKKVYQPMLEAGVPRRSTLLLFAVEKMVMLFGRAHPGKGIEDCLETFTSTTFRNMGTTLASDVSAAAEYLWTSTEMLGTVEFCSVLNTVIREDQAENIMHACVVVCSINRLRLGVRGASGARAEKSKLNKFPTKGRLYRGSAMPHEHLSFFNREGRKFRIPAFLATSTSKRVAKKFCARISGIDVCIWTIHLDERGKKDPMYRCKHAALVDNTLVKGENEYLFAPYSVFTVTSLTVSSKAENPHKIKLEASIDNRKESESLPLAPWY